MAAARLQRWAIILSAYQYDIRFKPTDAHANADGLSRLPLSIASEHSISAISVFNLSQIDSLPITSAQITTGTRKDSILSKVLYFTKNSWPEITDESLKPYHSRDHSGR